MERAQVLEYVLTALREQVEADGDHDASTLGESTPLIGEESPIDSLGLVNIIVDVEQRLLDEHGTVVTIVDDKAMSQRYSPFRTAGTLSDYVASLGSGDPA